MPLSRRKSRLENELGAEQRIPDLACQSDIREAAQLGIDGVPFFVFDRKYAVSGAQEMSAFASVLEQSYAERTRTASTA